MIFTTPIPFEEALRSREVKRIMPTNLGSADLAKIDVAIRERAVFSARTTNEQYLQSIADVVKEILNPTTQQRDDGSQYTAGLDQASARLRLKEVLQEIGYSATPGEEGTIKDLSSDARINLVLQTNVQMAQGYGYWQQGNSAEALDLYPAFELFRAESREQERPWAQDNGIWINAAREVNDTGAINAWAFHNKRMVARKDSPIWLAISDFGQPYPPFKFNSGMDIMDVDRAEAVELGVIDEDSQVQVQQRSFNMEVTP